MMAPDPARRRQAAARASAASIVGQPQNDTAWRRQLRTRLLRWFAKRQRDLPWRRQPDAYRVWISEVMLQQTQVATVIPYFERFLERFPTLEALAEADEQEVLRQWEGLGYYRRARQLHRAARIVQREHGGRFPADREQVLALPGIGRYTAGAILSIAFDQRQPIVEANTQRVYARLLACREPLEAAATQRRFWEYAEWLLPERRCGDFNQALMELGSTCCTPRDPDCASCPLLELCPTFRLGAQHQIPPPKARAAYEAIREAAVVIEHRARVLLRQCQPGERWAGLWDFPRFRVEANQGTALQAELAAGAERLAGLPIVPGELLTTLHHGVTRYRITLLCYRAKPAAPVPRPRPATSGLRWIKPQELSELPLSVTGRKIGRLLLGTKGT